MPAPFRTLSERAEEPEQAFEGVPVHLRESLVSILSSFAEQNGYFTRGRVLLLERLSKVPHLMSKTHESLLTERVAFTYNLRNLPGDDFLRVLDAAVRSSASVAASVNMALLEGGSLFEVKQVQQGDAKVNALERRLSDSMTATLGAIKGEAVGSELRAARHAIFGQGSNFINGMHHAVKAVEHAAAATVQPANSRATLGTMIGFMRSEQGPVQLQTAVADLPTVVTMCQALWNAEGPYRHGTAPAHEPAPPSRLQAEAAFSLAVTLCDWFGRGVITRT